MDTVDIRKIKGFDDHILVCFINDDAVSLKGFIAIHRNNSGHPSFGATRFWKYEKESDALEDALRLSSSMSYKLALAGIPAGGAKAVLLNDNEEFNRKLLFKEYATKVNLLDGNFITGTDVGLYRDDIVMMRRYSPSFVGIYSQPERYTAEGVVSSIYTVINHIYGSQKLNDRTFAVQGLGKVGSELVKYLYIHAKKIYVSEIDEVKLSEIVKSYPDIEVVHPDNIHKQAVDIFSPCALSNAINGGNIGELNCRAIVGAANNQLENDRIAKELYENDIFYGPDYVVNAGGVISVYDEYQHGNSKVRRVTKKVKQIGRTLDKILKESKKQKKDPLTVANAMAEKIFNGLH